MAAFDAVYTIFKLIAKLRRFCVSIKPHRLVLLKSGGAGEMIARV
jgi:hypothetical protein